MSQASVSSGSVPGNVMSPRLAAFRAAYRERVAPAYSGVLHVALIYLIGAAMMFVAVSHIQAVRWEEWLVIPVVAVLCNLFEWFLHAQIMHRPRRGLMGIYKRHTLAHHQFFTQEAPFHDTTRDYRIVFFPPYAFITFLAMSAVGAAVLDGIWSSNAAWLLIATTTGYYMNYEFFHWGCHIKDDRILRHVPFMNTIRRHHIAHHDTTIMMNKNMNLTYPFADWLFGSSDLDRGVLGHLFNGYSTRWVKAFERKARPGAVPQPVAAE